MRLILLRHGESIGNVDESAFCRIPDHSMELTAAGDNQARAAGVTLREVVGAGPVDVFVSPYRRTWQTLELLDLGPRIRRVREEPRLREQDWGNLQQQADQVRQRQERDAFGHFFYRLDSGESGADVYDRVTGFLSGLTAPDGIDDPGRTVLLVTHGLTMRLACMALMGWTVSQFEALSNPGNGDHRVLTQLGGIDGGRTGGGLLGLGAGWELDRPFDTWNQASSPGSGGGWHGHGPGDRGIVARA
jgi:broad specificity phosphatase PhoE